MQSCTLCSPEQCSRVQIVHNSGQWTVHTTVNSAQCTQQRTVYSTHNSGQCTVHNSGQCTVYTTVDNAKCTQQWTVARWQPPVTSDLGTPRTGRTGQSCKTGKTGQPCKTGKTTKCWQDNKRLARLVRQHKNCKTGKVVRTKELLTRLARQPRLA